MEIQGNKMKVTLRMVTPEIEISECSKICYGTKLIKDGGKDITSTLVHQHKHLASLRFAYMTVNVKDISVACQNQIVRSKHLDFMVQSKRYVNPDKGDFKFIMPEGLSKTEEHMMWSQWRNAILTYNNLIDSGVKKEDARAILPMNTSTEMNITGNLQSWNDFFKLRLNSHAQHEIRQVATAIWALAKENFPQVFTDEVLLKFTKENNEKV